MKKRIEKVGTALMYIVIAPIFGGMVLALLLEYLGYASFFIQFIKALFSLFI